MNAALSPRFRYRYLPRIAWGVGGLIAVGIVVGGMLLLFPSKDEPGPGTLSNKPATVIHTDDTNVPLPKNVTSIAGAFITSTVTRAHLAQGWKLLGPCTAKVTVCLNQNMTRKEWMSGNIPVVPYPAYGGVKFRIGYSHKADVLLEVAVFPRRGSTLKPAVFDIGLHKYGKRWLVNYWAPRGVSAVPSNGG
jgi:hypothetical protein